MAADVHANEQQDVEEPPNAAARGRVEHHPPGQPDSRNGGPYPVGNDPSNDDVGGEADEDDDDDDEDDEEQEDEPKLKYAKLTGSLTNVYRNGDSTSATCVAGDKMVLGTHNGNVHVLSLPSLQPLRTYHAHSAAITSISISPTPPPPPSVHQYADAPTTLSPPPSIRSQPTTTNSPRTPRASSAPTSIPNTPNNAIYIATSSVDGHVCITSLLDPKDVQLRNFARPLQAVALSPQYTDDRTYLSGGLAGQLILTIGGKAGVTVDANTNSAAAAAGGWLSGLGLGGDRGKDSALHAGEGKIGEIKWSLTGKWVVWINEEGIKIMRSHLKLGSEQSEDAWRRIAHAARPNRTVWEDMAGVWRGRAAWISEKKLEADGEGIQSVPNGSTKGFPQSAQMTEKLVVGWGDTMWILHIKEGGTNAAGKKQVGSADIVHKTMFMDCVISGITLFTPSTLAILAYRTKDDNDRPVQQVPVATKRGRAQRHTGLAPQLRLIEAGSAETIDVDELSMSRFETLAAQDYHLGTLWIPPPPASKSPANASQEKGALEGLWDAAGGKYASRIFSSSASVLSRSSGGDDKTATIASPPASSVGVAASSVTRPKRRLDAHPFVVESGLKLFIMSPYDCVLAIKRDPSDRLDWLLERKDYKEAWQLLESRPGTIATDRDDRTDGPLSTADSPTSDKDRGSLADFFADASVQDTADKGVSEASRREKRRIGDLWIQQLVAASRWSEGGQVCAKVLGTSGKRWEHWVWTFAQANKFEEITPHVPKTSDARLPGVVYEVILGHYVQADPERLLSLLEEWDPSEDLYDVGSVIKAVESRLDSAASGNEDAVEEGSEEWKTLTDCLARLYLANARARDALRCWILVQNADAAFKVIREEKLMDIVGAEDVPGFVMLRVSKDTMTKGSLRDLSEASAEAVGLLVEEALRGSIPPATVIDQLEREGPSFRPFIYFYLKALWNSSVPHPSADAARQNRPKWKSKLHVDDGHALVEDHADLAVELFAQYDRELLLTLLKASSIYSYEKAAAICERQHYIPELVHILSKTGQTKRALFLIIGELGDVKQAIDFAKENSSKDGELWDDLLDYGMDKPAFIRGLLEEVGTAIDPIKLVRRIPEGLEIEGLREGVSKMMREYDIQYSISEGVAKVLRGEVATGMDTLRAGQKKAVRFEVLHQGTATEDVKLEVHDPPTNVPGGKELTVPKRKAKPVEAKKVRPGCCVSCGELFHDDENEPLIGFACGHVYHLSCLLRANPDTSDEATIDRLLGQLRSSNDDEFGTSIRSVGAKVAHAHIIKNVLRGGCRHCHIPDGA